MKLYINCEDKKITTKQKSKQNKTKQDLIEFVNMKYLALKMACLYLIQRRIQVCRKICEEDSYDATPTAPFSSFYQLLINKMIPSLSPP